MLPVTLITILIKKAENEGLKIPYQQDLTDVRNKAEEKALQFFQRDFENRYVKDKQMHVAKSRP